MPASLTQRLRKIDPGYRPDTFYDPLQTRVTTGFGVAHQNDDDVLIEHRQDIQPLLEHNRRLRDAERSRPGEFRPICSLDPVTYMKLHHRGIAPDQDQKAFRRWLETDGVWWKTTHKRLWIPKQCSTQSKRGDRTSA